MKKLIRASIVAFAVLCSVSAVSLSAVAASTPSNAAPSYSGNKTGYTASSGVTDGSYHYTSRAKAAEKLAASNFSASTVYVDPKTHAVYNVYDGSGNLIPATLSTDGHWYIVPTNEGNILIATGR